MRRKPAVLLPLVLSCYPLCEMQVEIGLEPHPEARRVAEALREAQRRVGADAALAEDDLVDAARRHADLACQRVLGETGGLQELLVEDPARMFFHLMTDPVI